jgi:PAS domain-containing protein
MLSPNDLLSKLENVSGVEEVPFATLARALAALRPDDDLILEQSKQLENLNHRLDVALDNMGRGLSMFDAAARLIVCNKQYREIYGLPEELTRPGTTLADIVRHHVKRETGRDDPEELEKQGKWIEHHVAELARGKSFSHTQFLNGGRKQLRRAPAVTPDLISNVIVDACSRGRGCRRFRARYGS